ncbi:MAG: tRNA methyltransferase [Desulfitibacter sp. BRH_c19]|nr:MAG: tRNA methyltransferase [Desulfitibacter sp. BRH_c19]
MKIAFIGIGAMGKPMAKNLLTAGYHVTVNDVYKATVEEMVHLGAKSADTPGETAKGADVVITMLPNYDIVNSCMNGNDGVFSTVKPGTKIIDMSSVAPGQTKKIAEIAEQKGLIYIDAPVSGGVTGAEKGALTIMVGGPEKEVQELMPLFEKLGKKIYHVGPVGSGDAVKIVNNLLLGINMAALAEALVLGTKAGIKPEVLYEIISSSSGSSYALEAKVPKFILEGNFEPGFAIDLQYKDLDLAIQTGKDLGVPMFLTNLAQQIYENSRAGGMGKKDISAVIQYLEKLTDVEVRKG